MKYFKQDHINFLRNFSENTNKEWFEAHKIYYKSHVEVAFKYFITDLITALQPYIPSLTVEAKDCIFRIHRDVRFSRDKTPYKTHLSALISVKGRKDKATPGAYIELTHHELRLYSGSLKPNSQQVEKIRQYIFTHIEEWNTLLANPFFVQTFSKVLGDSYKRIPKAYQHQARIQPVLYNKAFYYFKSYSPAQVLQSNIIAMLIKDYQHCVALNMFLTRALQS